jgi:hypothetical protein
MADGKKLDNPKRELFCQLYATHRSFFGNGVQAYGEAYDIDLSNPRSYAGARTSAYELLTNPDILSRIDELLELGPLNDTVVDRHLAFVIEQHADMKAKNAAISEYNRVKGRIKTKLDVTTAGKPLGTFIDVLGGQNGNDGNAGGDNSQGN